MSCPHMLRLCIRVLVVVTMRSRFTLHLCDTLIMIWYLILGMSKRRPFTSSMLVLFSSAVSCAFVLVGTACLSIPCAHHV